MPNKNINKSPSELWAKRTHKPNIHWSTSNPQQDLSCLLEGIDSGFWWELPHFPRGCSGERGERYQEGKNKRRKGGGREEISPHPPNGNYCPIDIITKPTQDGAQGPKNEIKVYLDRIF